MKKKYGVYRARTLVLNPNTKTDALFNTKKEAYDLCNELNQHDAGFWVAEVMIAKKGRKLP